ncbi:MAG: hypothetical protein ABSA23_00350 [Anaerolineales bacterium]|jgi:hypothetical protein
MKKISKWALIIWSILCLIGICVGLFNLAKSSNAPQNNFESAGQAMGLGCGLGIWFVLWIALAGPALVVYLVSGKKESTKVEIVQTPIQSKLCPECGKYYVGQPRFCPNCGQELNLVKKAAPSEINITTSQLLQAAQQPSVRLCPKCGLPMEIKIANKGAQQSEKFYVCPNYDKCKQFFPVEG